MTYDVAILGSGPGGYVAAIRAAQLGLKTICIEKSAGFGGTCLNVGCIPSKVLLYDSERSKDFQRMMVRKQEVIAKLAAGIQGLFQKHKVASLQGVGTLIAPHTIDVQGTQVEAKHIILATGSEPISLPFLPFDEQKIISSTGALSLTTVPKKMLVVGAGVIGVELGSVYKRLGSEVTFIEFCDRICPTFDQALSRELLKMLTAQGMNFHLSHKVIQAKGTTLTVQDLTGEKEFTADVVLVAIGRRPYTENLGLQTLGIQKDPKGFIVVDDSFRTHVPHIFAIGDLIDGPMLAHKASIEGTAVAELIAGRRPLVHYACIPSVAYTHPEVAAVGFTEEDLKAKNVPYQSATVPFKANARARCMGEMEGFVKMLVHADTHKLLGVHIIGQEASELIAGATLAMQLGATAEDLAATCYAHPTLSEALQEAAQVFVQKEEGL